MSLSSSLEQGRRINVRELKTQIVKRVGTERADHYFSYLNRLLSHKLSKPEFNKLCLLTLGHDNLPFHNQLIRSILKNAFQAKVQPPPPTALKPVGDNWSTSSPTPPMQNGLPNADFLPPTLRRSRSGGLRRVVKDRPSPLGTNGRADFSPHHLPLRPHDAEGVVAMENGDLIPCDLKRSVQQHQLSGSTKQLAKRPRLEKLSSDHSVASVCSKDLAEMVLTEDGEESEHQRILNSARGPLRAPLGITFRYASVSGARRSLALPSTSAVASNYDVGELCQTEVLRKRMEVLAQAKGLAGVTVDCANLLNIGLDSYLKGLIRSCVELVGARIGHEPVKQQPHHSYSLAGHEPVKQQPHSKAINGVWLRNHSQVQSSAGPSEGNLETRSHYSMALQDFRVAMELNPQKLGEDWPLLLEKICLSSFEK